MKPVSEDKRQGFRLTATVDGVTRDFMQMINQNRRAQVVEYALGKIFENYANDPTLQWIAGLRFNPLDKVMQKRQGNNGKPTVETSAVVKESTIDKQSVAKEETFPKPEVAKKTIETAGAPIEEDPLREFEE